MEPCEVHEQGVPDCCQLGGDHRQHGHINTVKLIKTPPRSTLTQPGEDLTNGLQQTKVSQWGELDLKLDKGTL